MKRTFTVAALFATSSGAGCAAQQSDGRLDATNDELVDAPLDTKHAWAVA